MRHILIVDDAATVRMYHRTILEAAGYAVEEATNGLEALEKALERPFDLYIVDVNMPRLNGYDFLRRLRQEAIVQAPAIMVSTESELRDRTEAYRAGASSYLCKPVDGQQLLLQSRLLLGVAP